MAHGWVKSLQCKSRSAAFDDVYDPSPRRPVPPTASSSCRSGSQALKDVLGTARNKPRKPKPDLDPPRGPGPNPKPKRSDNNPRTDGRVGPTEAPTVRTPAGILYPALTELPDGHPSRRVVEIIFHTSWGPKAFSGRVEVVFKVQNGPKAAARFEEYREAVKSRSWGAEDAGRCVADGNEVMRFQCVGPAPFLGGGGRGAGDYPGGVWGSLQHRGKVAAAVCTFSGSGRAHESVGGGKGRRAMLVCRVVAGRVANRAGADPFGEGRVGFDSVSGDDGELLVYDPRAVLPCFLIIYRL